MTPEPLPPYDRARALASLGGDEALLEGLLELLRQNGASMQAAVDDALEAGDLAAAAPAAHRLAGAVANLHARPSRDAALELERAAEAGDLAAATEAHARLRAAFDRLLQSVTPPGA